MLCPWGTELALDPFFGIMAVAPPAAWGAVSFHPAARLRRGNMDNKELKPGDDALTCRCSTRRALFMAG